MNNTEIAAMFVVALVAVGLSKISIGWLVKKEAKGIKPLDLISFIGFMVSVWGMFYLLIK